ncbi:MAG: MFS transporter [Dehalococcoidia bacterium]|nr:MFS transporter [Dehalococcoidia bacterium]
MKPRPKFFYGWIVVAAAFIIIMIGYGLRNSFSIFYPAIVEEFGWSRGNTALMFSIHIGVYGLAAPIVGSMVDRFNPRLVLSVGACVVGGGIALCSLATSQWQFYLLYGVMVAVGLSMIGITPLSTIITNWFVEKRGLVIGILTAGFGTSLVSAPIVQLLIFNFGWQNAYIFIGLCSIPLIVPLCIFLMRRSPQEKGLLPDGRSQQQALSKSQAQEKHVGLNEQWVSTTWTLRRAMKTYHFWFIFLMSFCSLGFAEQVGITHLVYFLRDAGYEPMQAATIYSVFGITFAVGNLFSYLSDRLGREKVFITSCLLGVGAVLLLFLITDTTKPWMPFLFAVLLGLGLGIGGPVMLATVADLFQGKYLGSIIGFVILGCSLGGGIAPWLTGFLHDRSGNYFAITFMVLACFVAAAVLMWLVAPRKIRPVPHQDR